EELSISEAICRLTAAIAAHPARLKNDGDLFREDKRRLENIRGDEDEPSLNTCLWIAEGLGWLVRVDNTLRAGNLDNLIGLNRLQRHRLVYDWLNAQNTDASACDVIERALADLRPGAWYRVMDFIEYARKVVDHSEASVLRAAGAHYEFVSPSASRHLDTQIARALEERLCWLGVIGRGECEGDACFYVTELGAALLANEEPPALLERYPTRTCSFVVQPNYEIVASIEDMDPLMTAQLEAFAERVSEDRMLVYRLSRDCFVRALQEGRQADTFIAFLLTHSREKLPENVRITLSDWCGAAKQVRLRTYHVIEADDPLLVAELEHNRQWREYVAPVAPHTTLRYHNISKTQLKRALEKEGYIVR
ncbi:MAG TPA: hypothetical protein ENN65_02920, partial [Candidatus Hydrogenedentes bacterium]|nr:hypothetical protein [Candidatus Hydrogenedentota bacterium]